MNNFALQSDPVHRAESAKGKAMCGSRLRPTVKQQGHERVQRNLEDTDWESRSEEKTELRTVEEGLNQADGKCPVLEGFK